MIETYKKMWRSMEVCDKIRKEEGVGAVGGLKG